MGFLLAIACVKKMFVFIIITSFPPIQAQYNLNNTQLGSIISVFYLFGLFGSFFWTILLGKDISHMKTFTSGGIICIFGYLIIFFNISYGFLIFSMVLISFGGESLNIIVLNYYMENIKRERSGISVAIYFIVQGLGGMLGTFISGIFEGIYSINWNVILGAVGLLLSIFIAVIIILLKKNPRTKQSGKGLNYDEMSELILQPLENKITKDLLKKTVFNKINFSIFLFLLIFIPINLFNNIWLQKFWIEEHNLTQTMASISIIFTSAGEFLGLVVSGINTDKIKKEENLMHAKHAALGSFLAAPFIFIAYLLVWEFDPIPTQNMNYIEICWFMFLNAFSDISIFFSYFFLFLGFFILQFVGPIFLIMLMKNNSSETKPLAINIAIITINIGQFIGPILGGWIGDNYGLQNTLLIVPIIYVITSVIYINIYFRIKNNKMK
jgi:MFS family permease